MIHVQWRRIRTKYPWLQKFHSYRCVVIFFILIVIIWYTASAFKKHPKIVLDNRIPEVTVGDVELDFQTGLVTFRKDENDVYLRASISDELQQLGAPVQCGKFNKSRSLCAEWHSHVRLEVSRTDETYATCHKIKWTPTIGNFSPKDCFSLSGKEVNWYGGSVMYDQKWPLNKISIPLSPYISHDLTHYAGKENQIGNVLERIWINSRGVGIFVDHNIPLHISINEFGKNLICFQSKYDGNRSRRASLNKVASLKYTVCKGMNLKKIHKYLKNKYIQFPQSLPSEVLFKKPIWSPFPYLSGKMDQDNILKFVQDIRNHKFPAGLLDMYSPTFSFISAYLFPVDLFPNGHQMVSLIRESGFNISVGVTPFLNQDSTDFKNKQNMDYFILKPGLKEPVPVLIPWNGEKVAIVSLHNPHALDWFQNRLSEIKKDYGIHFFKFVGGENSFLPENLRVHSREYGNPGEYTKKFSKVASSFSDSTSVLTFGYQSQSLPGIIQITANQSSWNSNGGLQSVIPTVLTLGLIGYPFIIPNVIGGNGYNLKTGTNSNSEVSRMNPDEKLYIRWLELATYMPCMMFSYPPWLYSASVVEFAKKMIREHEEKVAPLILKAAREAEVTGAPIIRPLWWIDPDDKEAQVIDDEYLIGGFMLVAPVVREGKTVRDIYLPHGQWKDNLRNVTHHGNLWLRSYIVQLKEIATFSWVRVTD
ncbi:hypothetical protein ACJMK2_010322 [Sinanodonta woodiana]|uniref:Family 31 glucosidase KIAA1161 n=1 Tax=Sinanodonta woodiana TaxID=1069815 RepID=A0ABD3VEZ9_SINWO